MNKKYDYTYEGQQTPDGNEFILCKQHSRQGVIVHYQLRLMDYEKNYTLISGDEEEFVTELDAIISYLSAVRQDILTKEEPLPEKPFNE